jgi:hypothetical protein
LAIVVLIVAVVLLLGISLSVVLLVVVPMAKRRSAGRPFRVPATLASHCVDEPSQGRDGNLHLEVAVAWPGEPEVPATLDESTRARLPLPTLVDGMPVAVFVSPDRATVQLDWSFFDPSSDDREGVVAAVFAAVPKGSKNAAELESRDWQVTCNRCGFTRSVWQTGGVRYKAAGESIVRMACPGCEQRGAHRIWRPRKPDPTAA